MFLHSFIMDLQTLSCTELKPAMFPSRSLPNYTPGQQFTSARLTKKTSGGENQEGGTYPVAACQKELEEYFTCLAGRSKGNHSVLLADHSRSGIAASKYLPVGQAFVAQALRDGGA